VPFIPQVLLKGKLSALLLISGIRSTSSLHRYLDFPIIKGRPKRSNFFLSLKKCIQGSLLGKINFSTNQED